MKRIEKRIESCLEVNLAPVHTQVEARQTLADFLREELGLTSVHLGCEHGFCGACTVLVDGEAVRSCLLLAVQANGCQVTTLEGLAENNTQTPLQRAFCDHDALQCGFCTPGFLMTATALLRQAAELDEGSIRTALRGNLCRCTGYQGIVNAILEVAQYQVELQPQPLQTREGDRL